MAAKWTANKAELLLGERIKRLRLLNNMSCMELGRKLNKKEQDVVKYEKGSFVPLGVLENIAEILGEPISKKIIRKISKLRKLEMATKVEQEELVDLYEQVLIESEEGLL